MFEEEEKVPNEHPKRQSIGLGYYKTNYFSSAQAEHPRQDGGSDEERFHE